MLPATSITLAHISTQTDILVFISHSSFISKAWLLQDLLENSCRRKEQKNIFFQTSHGMCLRPVRTINSATWDNGTDPLVCVYTAEWYTMCVMRGWPFANGLPMKWWIISSGRTRSNAEEHQEDTAYTWQQQTSWSHVSKENQECQQHLCIFRWEVYIVISVTSIKTASDHPEYGVFIAELIPNSVAHNAGLKVKNMVYISMVQTS